MSRQATKRKRAAKKTKTARGGVGEGIFRAVERLTAGGKTTKLAAFKKLAKSGGRSLGTVAANYYRVARQKGAKLQPRRRRRRVKGGPRGGKLQRSATRILGRLERLLHTQERELQTLLKENQRLAAVRRLLGS